MTEDVPLDPITLEIWWSRLVNIADEAATALVRTAFSTIVRESNDYAAVLMDENGDSLAENTGGIPSFSCILPTTTKHFLQKFPKADWREGDCIVTNDPWLATGHLPDITAVSPIFLRGRLAGFAGSIAHSPDIGGSLWAADCRELFEEGLRIPPMRLYREGVRNEALVELLLGNVRVPAQVLGDLEAQLVANQVCLRRTREFLDDTGLEDLRQLSRAIRARAEAATRQAIAALPDGVYRASVDADGFDADRTHIALAITVAGDTMDLDYAGSSRQIDRGINCVMNYTHAYSVYPVKCALDPLTPRNQGSYAPIQVRAPEGCILNPRIPAPVGSRQLTGHLLSAAIFRALAPVIPERIIADCGGAPSMRALFSGADRAGRRFSQILFASGGMGATPISDGLGTTAYPTNAGAGSIEAFEASAPLVVWQKEYRCDSGGAGRFRGGLGQDCVIENVSDTALRLSLISDRRDHPALGVLGGMPGATVRIRLDDGSAPHPKSRTSLPAGARLHMSYAGGGGYGPPAERAPDALQADLRDGVVSAEAAARDWRR